MITKVNVLPATGLKVRTENGARHIRDGGESVTLSSYYRRRIAAGDLVKVKTLPKPVKAEPAVSDVTQLEAQEAKPEVTLASVLASLDQNDPAQVTEGGKPSLNYLSDVLNRRVTRKEVDAALMEMEA